MLAMPVEIQMLWPIFRIAGEENPPPLEISEALAWHSLFHKLFSVQDDPVIIAQRPEPPVKLPVGVFRKRYPISGVIVAGVAELMYLGGINDGLHIEGGHPITRESTGVFVGENDHLDTKTGFASSLNTGPVSFLVFMDFGHSGLDL
jgi:hypothetical protein